MCFLVGTAWHGTGLKLTKSAVSCIESTHDWTPRHSVTDGGACEALPDPGGINISQELLRRGNDCLQWSCVWWVSHVPADSFTLVFIQIVQWIAKNKTKIYKGGIGSGWEEGGEKWVGESRIKMGKDECDQNVLWTCMKLSKSNYSRQKVMIGTTSWMRGTAFFRYLQHIFILSEPFGCYIDHTWLLKGPQLYEQLVIGPAFTFLRKTHQWWYIRYVPAGEKFIQLNGGRNMCLPLRQV